MTDLRYWIEEQIEAERSTQQTPSLKENPSAQNLEVGGVVVPTGPSIRVKEPDAKEATKSTKGKSKSKSQSRERK